MVERTCRKEKLSSCGRSTRRLATSWWPHKEESGTRSRVSKKPQMSPLLIKFCQPGLLSQIVPKYILKTAPPVGNQILKHMILWGMLHNDTISIVCIHTTLSLIRSRKHRTSWNNFNYSSLPRHGLLLPKTDSCGRCSVKDGQAGQSSLGSKAHTTTLEERLSEIWPTEVLWSLFLLEKAPQIWI